LATPFASFCEGRIEVIGLDENRERIVFGVAALALLGGKSDFGAPADPPNEPPPHLGGPRRNNAALLLTS
jgi:hypothetical protein